MKLKQFDIRCKIDSCHFGGKLLILALLAGSLTVCAPRRSDQIELPYPIWMVAEGFGESGGYTFGDPFALYLIQKEGALHRVTDHLDRAPTPAWAPDGTSVVFWVESSTGNGFFYNLYLATATGADTKPLTYQVGYRRSDPSPAKWSPTSDRLAFLADSGTGEHLYLINKDGTDLIELMDLSTTSGWHAFAWCPDGECIAVQFNRNGRLTINLIKLTPEREFIELTSDESTRPTERWSPVWSPDGNKLAYYSAAGVAITDVNTGDTAVLTNDYGQTSGPLMWSPNGKWIAFVARSAQEDRFECSKGQGSATAEFLFLLASNGSSATRLTPISHNSAAWAPDGEKLAFILCNDIFTISTEKRGDPQQITSIDKGYTGWPVWSPDGNWILYTLANIYGYGFLFDELVGILYATNVDGTRQFTLTDAKINVNTYGWLEK
jgi:Tol biopolymer transport system component